MSFFEEVDSMGLIERHIGAVESLEEDETKKLLSKYKSIRQELRDRLDRLPETSYSAQKLRGVLAQVDGALAAMGDSLKSGISPSIRKMALQSATDLEAEIGKFSKHFTGAAAPVNVDALAVALDTENFLINRFQASIDAYTQQTRQIMTQQITNAIIEEAPLGVITKRMNQYLMLEEWKLLRIGRTELHNVYNLGKMTSMTQVQERYLPDLKKTLIHPMDNRTGEDSKQLARKNPIVDIDKPFEFTYVRKLQNGQTRKEKRVFMVPPDRPNDRAILVPYRAAWN
jgi:hypothetical protein